MKASKALFLSNMLEEKEEVTLTDSVVTIPDGQDSAIQSLRVGLEPIQDLHGYDNPWPAGGGKNKFDYSKENIVLQSMSNTDGVFTNTNTDSRTYFNMQVSAMNGSTIVTLSTPQNIASSGRKSATITVESTITSINIVHNGSQRNVGLTYPFEEQGEITVSFDVTGHDPTTVGGLSFKDVQIESGSSMTSYAPYSNICPISGRSEVKIHVADGENPHIVDNVYTISLGQTVYGGELDVTSGVLVITQAIADMSNFTWRETSTGYVSSSISNAKRYPDGVPNNTIFSNYKSKPSKRGGYYIGEPDVISQNYNGVLYTVATDSPTGQICYELDTPITYQLTPTEVEMLTGENNIWSDTGDVSVTYTGKNPTSFLEAYLLMKGVNL